MPTMFWLNWSNDQYMLVAGLGSFLVLTPDLVYCKTRFRVLGLFNMCGLGLIQCAIIMSIVEVVVVSVHCVWMQVASITHMYSVLTYHCVGMHGCHAFLCPLAPPTMYYNKCFKCYAHLFSRDH